MKERINWIDSLRGLGIYLVILGHAFINKKHNPFRDYIYAFHMPLFFIISGLTAKRESVNIWLFIKKRFKSLLLPYIFINLFVLIFKYMLHLFLGMYQNINLSSSIIYFFKGYSDYLPCIQSWFLVCLFLVEVIFFILTKIFKKDWMVFLSVVLIFILGVKCSSFEYEYLKVWHINTALIGLLFYFTGYLFMKFLRYIKPFFDSYYALIIGIILLFVGYYIESLNGRISMNNNVYNDIYLFLLSSFILCFAVIFINNKLYSKNKFLIEIGKMSLFYYGYHAFLLTTIKKFIPLILSYYYCVTFTSLLVFIILYPVSKLATKYVPILVGKISFKKRL